MLNPSEFRRPVAFVCAGIGDTLLALPALRALAELFPCRLAVVCEPFAQNLFYGELAVERFVPLEVVYRGGGTERKPVFDPDATAAALGPRDLFLSLVPGSGAKLGRLVDELHASTSIGLAGEFDVAIPRSHERHAFDLAFAVPQLFDPSLEVERFAAPPSVDEASLGEATEIVSLLPDGCRILAVHVETKAHKTWPAAQLRAALAEFLGRHADFWALLLGVRSTAPLSRWNGLRVGPCEGLAMAPSLAILRHADVFVGVDSCMLHAADLFGTPGVGLFGPTRPSEFGFRLARHRHVDGLGTMAGVTVDATVEALDALVRESDG